MSRLNWQRARDRDLARAAAMCVADTDEAFSRRVLKRRPRVRARRNLHGTLVRYQGGWAALVDHAPTIPPVVGEPVACLHQSSKRSGTVRVTAIVWSRDGRSLAKVERV